MYRYGYAGLCAALIVVGLTGVAHAQDPTPKLDELRAILKAAIEAEVKDNIGRYQIVPVSDLPHVWILDTATGQLRFCGPRPKAARSENPAHFVISCSPWGPGKD